ncbi:MAG: hypothetical protein IAF38_14120, partial [Bacteroidia bacterium]|nr:hypothetical protein [Bacteroidia bacterium]
MKKNLLIIFVFSLCGKFFSQTQVITFEKDPIINKKPIPFGISILPGVGYTGNTWANVPCIGINARVHYNIFTVTGFAAFGDA